MSDSAARLNQRFGVPGQLEFRPMTSDADSLVFAEIANPLATARICLQGAHVVTWQPRDQSEPVIWVSQDAAYLPGKSIRGGIPVCWPWFGPDPSNRAGPAHGFVRTVAWSVAGARALAGGATELTLVLADDAASRALWPHPFRLELQVVIGTALTLSLATTNPAHADLELGEALHAYFRIGDIGTAQVGGLERAEYIDKLDDDRRKRQHGAVHFDAEVDRIYVDTDSACVIDDPDLGRRIRIEKTGSRSTVVWTPWLAKATRMGDLGTGSRGQGGWREMVCVESGNALHNRVSVPPGATHRLQVDYSVERSSNPS